MEVPDSAGHPPFDPTFTLDEYADALGEAVVYRQMLQIALGRWHEETKKSARLEQQIRLFMTGRHDENEGDEA